MKNFQANETRQTPWNRGVLVGQKRHYAALHIMLTAGVCLENDSLDCPPAMTCSYVMRIFDLVWADGAGKQRTHAGAQYQRGVSQ